MSGASTREPKYLHKPGPHEIVAIDQWWPSVRTKINGWRSSFEWPQGASLEKSLKKRDELEAQINADLKKGYLSLATFDNILIWGFGRSSGCQEAPILEATKEAFSLLNNGELDKAVLRLMMLNGIGISRASKILALSDQNNLAIYDSNVASGLSDLQIGGNPLIRIPPGQMIDGQPTSKPAFSRHFARFQAVMQHIRNLAVRDNAFPGFQPKVADVEVAFFARSRLERAAR